MSSVLLKTNQSSVTVYGSFKGNSQDGNLQDGLRYHFRARPRQEFNLTNLTAPRLNHPYGKKTYSHWIKTLIHYSVN